MQANINGMNNHLDTKIQAYTNEDLRFCMVWTLIEKFTTWKLSADYEENIRYAISIELCMKMEPSASTKGKYNSYKMYKYI
jgi:hypothetical protein